MNNILGKFLLELLDQACHVIYQLINMSSTNLTLAITNHRFGFLIGQPASNLQRKFYADRSPDNLGTQLEVWFYINGPSRLAAPISSKQFFGLQICFQQIYQTYICLNSTDLSKQKYILSIQNFSGFLGGIFWIFLGFFWEDFFWEEFFVNIVNSTNLFESERD